MNLFGSNKEPDEKSSPVVSDKTKETTGLIRKTFNKVADVLHKKFGSTTSMVNEPKTNSQYLGEIYKLLVETKQEEKLEREKMVNHRKEEDSEDQKRHREIIKALSLRRPKPKRVVRREKKAEEKAAKKEEQPTPQQKPAEKQPQQKPAEKPPEKAPEKAAKKEEKPSTEQKPVEKPDKKPQQKPEEKPADQGAQKGIDKGQANKAKEEAERKAKAEAERKAKEEAERKAAEEAKKKAEEEAKRKAKEEAERKAKAEAERKAKEEAERKAKEEAEKKAKAEAERKATAEKLKKEEQERLKREAAERQKQAEKLKEQKPPEKPPSAQPAPSVPRPAPTAEPMKYGYLNAAGLAAVTSAHEGNAESVYGDIGIAGKSKNIKNKYSDRPEVWSLRELGKEKKLTELTFAELLQYQKYRNNIKTSTGAVGIAGFMPSTIFGPKLDGSTGLFKLSGLSWNDTFTEKNQTLLKNIMDDDADKILLNGLKKFGITTITPGMKIAANYVGASGLLWVVEEGKKNPNITVRDALKNRNGGKDVTKIKQSGDESPENTINSDLRTTLAVDFINKKEQWAKNQAIKLGLIDKNTGQAIDQSSKENKDMKGQTNSSPPVINNNVTNVDNSTQSSGVNKVDDRPAHKRK